MPDLKDQLARRIRDRLRLHLGPNALSLAKAGAPLMLNSGEADQVADIACEVLAELGLLNSERPTVIIDPAQNFGHPALGRSRTPVDAILDRLDAGDDWQDVADDHGLTKADLLVACWFEARYGVGPHPRDQWLDWLEAYGPSLWKAANYDDIPLPHGWATPEEAS